MNDQDRLANLLRSALPPTTTREPSRDLWPLVLERSQMRPVWSWLDLGLAAALALVFFAFPRLLLVLVYHL